MATQPDPGNNPDAVPAPDTIEPQSPTELPVPSTPDETPAGRPDEIVPETPDFDQPDSAPPEITPDVIG
ncbi:MAG: hypothetical protein ABW164_09830 [Sphingobium sp.]